MQTGEQSRYNTRSPSSEWSRIFFPKNQNLSTWSIVTRSMQSSSMADLFSPFQQQLQERSIEIQYEGYSQRSASASNLIMHFFIRDDFYCTAVQKKRDWVWFCRPWFFCIFKTPCIDNALKARLALALFLSISQLESVLPFFNSECETGDGI